MAERQLPAEYKEFLKFLHSNKVSESCYRRKVVLKLDGIGVKVICKTDLIKSKLAANRPKDLADVVELRRIKSGQSTK